jgi:hypothetical protein
MSLYQASVPQLTKMLKNLSAWLDEATQYAEARPFDPDVLATSRLAPDMYPLTRQVQGACDSAKFAVARLSGVTAPPHADTEQTIDELRARIAACLDFIQGIDAKAFEGSETRDISLPFAPGKLLSGQDYLTEMALPNFYFHISMAYAILRHNGVALGKIKFIGSLTLRDA